MATNVNEYKCTACGGPLRYDGNQDRLVCDYCDSTFTREEIEAQYAAEIEAAKKHDEAKKEKDKQELEMMGMDQNLRKYSCKSCGAELICDPTTSATKCPYCDSPMVMAGQFTGEFAPDYVIPFKYDKKQAVAALKKFYEGKKFLPDSFTEGNHIEEIKGVYVPFWLYDSVAAGKAEFTGRKVKRYLQGNEEITETYIYNIRRAGTLGFEKIPFDSSTKMPDEHMDAIEPFDYSDLKEFSQSYLPGYMAEKYDVPVEEGQKKVEERAKNTISSLIAGTVNGYSLVQKVSESINIGRNKHYYALLPVWLLSTKWNGQNFLFAMNGQTGKLVGELPVDQGKYNAMFVKVAAIAGAVIAAIGLATLFL